MIDVRKEKLIPLAEVPHIPWLSKRPTVSTVFRWVQCGLLDRARNTVRLEFTQEGGRMSTSEDALIRFFDRLAEGVGQAGSTSADAARRHEHANHVLAAAGF